MLGDITVADEIYVICGYTDMRKSIDGLCAVVKDQLKLGTVSIKISNDVDPKLLSQILKAVTGTC